MSGSLLEETLDDASSELSTTTPVPGCGGGYEAQVCELFDQKMSFLPELKGAAVEGSATMDDQGDAKAAVEDAPDSCGDKVVELDVDAESVEIIRQKLGSMGDLGFLKKVAKINFRWNLIKKIEGLDNVGATLVELILVDNQITKLENLDALVNLKVFNASYNRILRVENLDNLKSLEQLLLVHNKIAKMENLDQLKKLKYLELGDNRIPRIEGLEALACLEELHLGANQIKKIENLEPVSATVHTLTLLGNCITKIEGLSTFKELRMLSLAQNGIRKMENLSTLQKLQILDLNDNIIDGLGCLEGLDSLKSLWLRKIKNVSVKSIQEGLAGVKSLRHLVLEGTELSREPRYRDDVIKALPNLHQLDSYPVWWIPGDPYQTRPDGAVFY